jgi:SAM-dependent methyltransferase
LELGCGVAEFSLIAARLVGPCGSLHGLDLDPAALEIARGRVQSAGHSHVTFELVEIQQFRPRRQYDAVIGRHILMHTQDPTEVLRRAVSMVHTGGVIAFQEFDVSSYWRGNPEMPLMFEIQSLICEFCRRTLSRPDIGTQLPKLMQDAGLPPPECRAEFSIDGGPHSPLYKWAAETVRSALPRMEELGLTTAAAVDIDTLEDRLRQERWRHAGSRSSDR